MVPHTQTCIGSSLFLRSTATLCVCHLQRHVGELCGVCNFLFCFFYVCFRRLDVFSVSGRDGLFGVYLWAYGHSLQRTIQFCIRHKCKANKTANQSDPHCTEKQSRDGFGATIGRLGGMVLWCFVVYAARRKLGSDALAAMFWRHGNHQRLVSPRRAITKREDAFFGGFMDDFLNPKCDFHSIVTVCACVCMCISDVLELSSHAREVFRGDAATGWKKSQGPILLLSGTVIWRWLDRSARGRCNPSFMVISRSIIVTRFIEPFRGFLRGIE